MHEEGHQLAGCRGDGQQNGTWIYIGAPLELLLAVSCTDCMTRHGLNRQLCNYRKSLEYLCCGGHANRAQSERLTDFGQAGSALCIREAYWASLATDRASGRDEG